MKGYIHMIRIMKDLFFSVLIKKPIMFSFDITNKCNLNCKMCYWQRQKNKKELTDKEAINLIKQMKKKGIRIGGYVGGEPLLREKLLRKITPLMPLNVIVTNGTIKCPRFKNSVIVLSIDGTEKIHDKMRGIKGLYKKIKKNFKDRKDAYISTTLTNDNKDQIEPLLKEWYKTSIKGMVFDFATPFIGEKNDFWISWKEREKIIAKLLKLKEEYGDFILMSKKSINRLRKKTIDTYPKKCTCLTYAYDFKSDGTLKKKCVLGEKADCSKCGVHLPTFVPPLLSFNPETIRIFKKTFEGV